MRTPHAGSAGHRADVEGLRAVAVGLVVAYHAGVPWVRGGFVGVDVFFVLSGFLITGLLAGELTRDGRLSFARFYGRRARRLLPMAALVIVVTALAFLWVVSPLDRGTLAGDLRAAALYVANWHFAASSLDYLGDPSGSPVLHFWSLGVEEQFYLVWPLLLVLVARRAAGRGAPTLAVRRMVVALSVLAVASFALGVVATNQNTPYAYYGLHTRAWELAAGGLLALGGARVARLPLAARPVLGWLGVAVVVASAFLIDASTPFPGVVALAPVLGTVLVVAAGAGGVLTGAGRLLARGPFTYVGRLSYAWYLWHWPALVFAGAVAAHGLSPTPFSTLAPARDLVALGAVVVSFLLSVLSHHALENPVRRSAWLAAVRRRSLVLGGALTAASVAATVVFLPPTDGNPGGPVLAPVAAVRPSQAPMVSRSSDRRVLLAMSPEQARRDEPRGTRDCYVGYFTTTADDDCLFGDPDGTVTIALIGDSHAEQWFPALQRVAEQRHWRLWMWAKSACPMIALPVRLPQFHGSYPWCDTWRNNVMARLEALPRLDAVVVSHYGSLVTRGSRFGGTEGRTLSQDEVPDAWRRAWAVTGNQIAALTRRVVVVRDVPKPSIDVPACLAEHGTDARPCSFDRAFAFDRADLLYDAERRAGVRKQAFLDFDDLLCPGATCPVVATDGTIVFRDTHHLTATMSRDLAPVVGRRLSRLLRLSIRAQTSTATYLVDRYSSIPSRPPSRPKPDCLTPPNAAAGLDTRPWLSPTIPASSASLTRIDALEVAGEHVGDQAELAVVGGARSPPPRW